MDTAAVGLKKWVFGQDIWAETDDFVHKGDNSEIAPCRLAANEVALAGIVGSELFLQSLKERHYSGAGIFLLHFLDLLLITGKESLDIVGVSLGSICDVINQGIDLRFFPLILSSKSMLPSNKAGNSETLRKSFAIDL